METAPFKTVLLVEDEENDIVFMTMAFKKHGIENRLHLAEDGQQAIDYLEGRGGFSDRVRHPLPAVILLDIKLPRVMGMDVLKWIRDRPEFDLVTVIMLTSSQQESDIRKAYALRANSYLVKPSNPFELGSLVDLIKRYWLQLNQPAG